MIRTSGISVFTVLSLQFLFSLSSAWAYTGTHGGSSVVCRTRQGEIKSVDLTDVYDFTGDSDHELLPPEVSEADVLAHAVSRLDGNTYFAVWLVALFNEFKTWVTPVQGPLPSIQDLGEVDFPGPGCKHEQLAVFDGSQIRVDRELYIRLSPLNRAALILHEAVYYIARTDQDQVVDNSHWARMVTGELLSITTTWYGLDQAIAHISRDLAPGTYRAGDRKLKIRFEEHTQRIQMITKDSGTTDLNLNWKTGNFEGPGGLLLIPGNLKYFMLNGETFRLRAGF